jgi:hypothetical protein
MKTYFLSALILLKLAWVIPNYEAMYPPAAAAVRANSLLVSGITHSSYNFQIIKDLIP